MTDRNMPVLLALLFALLVTAVPEESVAAHALLVESRPASGEVWEDPPEQVTLTFSQELDTGQSVVRVFDENGRQVDHGKGGVDLNDIEHKRLIVSLPSSLPTGSYTVWWRVTSIEDGDTTEDAFAFGLGAGAIVKAPVVPQEAGLDAAWLTGGIILNFCLLMLALYWFRQRQQATEVVLHQKPHSKTVET